MSDRIKFREMTLAEARRWNEDIEAMGEAEFKALVESWRVLDVPLVADEYESLRRSITSLFKQKGGCELKSTKMSPLDIEVGLLLRRELDRMGFTVADAVNDDVWRYISVKVFPDITYLRYPSDSEKGKARINQKRFYSGKWRIWLKSLWWYIHLSWQDSEEETFRVLEGNGSDIISHFIETPGLGHRVECRRALMREYANRKDRVTPLMFNSAMKLFGAECRTVEPALTQGGVSGCCKRLFDKVENSHYGSGQ